MTFNPPSKNSKPYPTTWRSHLERKKEAWMQSTRSTNPDNGYREALDLVKHEASLLWRIFGAFLLTHTVFLAISLGMALDGATLLEWRLGTFSTGCIGLVLCLPWWASYRRSSAYYIFRMAQAREKEPIGWDLLDGIGKRFSEGEPVMVAGECHQIKGTANWLRTKRGGPSLVIAFALAYVFVIVVSGPWWSA